MTTRDKILKYIEGQLIDKFGTDEIKCDDFLIIHTLDGIRVDVKIKLKHDVDTWWNLIKNEPGEEAV